MNKQLLFSCLILVSTLFTRAQNGEPKGACGTGAPSQQWEAWMSGEVEKYKENLKNGQAKPVGYVIPVIVHVIHWGETVGTFPNIDSNQVKSQLVVLNNDFNASGLNIGNTPSAFSNLIANVGVKFCRAKQNPAGTPLTDPGIDRINANSNTWLNPATMTVNLQNYFNSVIIPSTIWDPTKYLNIWVSARPSSLTLNGFATYPSNTPLTGLFNGNMGSTVNDGIWVWGKAFGTTGTIASPYDQGRTAVHELGHWLGLRHIWGDGNCLPDYCNDTPPSKQAHYGCVTSTPIDQCGVNQAPNGEMPFNFMDMSDDACKYMFTTDQNIRMQIALSQCPNRNILGTHGLCSIPSSAPSTSAVASFTFGSTQCLNTPNTPFNTSSGFPSPTFVWSSAPAAAFNPANTVANPGIVFNSPGTYTISLVATNSVSSSSHSMIVTANFSCAAQSICLDTLRMIKNVDTLASYKAPNNTNVLGCQTGFAGYLLGNNCYKDKEFAQYFPPTSYTSVPHPQVNSVIVLFDSIGTKATNPTAQVKCKIYGGNVTSGPGLAIGSKSDSIAKIQSLTKYQSTTLVGNPTVTLTTTKFIPFRFDMPTPVIINSNSGFYAGIEGPLSTSSDSIRIMSNTKYNNAIDSSAWYLSYQNNWRTFRQSRGYNIQMAIIPIITCAPVLGLNDYKNSLETNVNILPNPNNGIFSLIFTLPRQETVILRVYDALGQTILSEKMQNVGNNMLDMDLSQKSGGVYFIELSSGTEKITKKVVVTR